MIQSVEKDEQTGWYEDKGIIESDDDSWTSVGSGMKVNTVVFLLMKVFKMKIYYS